MEDSLLINTQEELQVLKKRDILYCQSERSYCTIFLQSQTSVLVTENLKCIAESFDPYFLRVSRSVVVHCRYIQRIDKKNRTIHLSNGATLNFTMKISELEAYLRNLFSSNMR